MSISKVIWILLEPWEIWFLKTNQIDLKENERKHLKKLRSIHSLCFCFIPFFKSHENGFPVLIHVTHSYGQSLFYVFEIDNIWKNLILCQDYSSGKYKTIFSVYTCMWYFVEYKGNWWPYLSTSLNNI